jgi:hypothetical protein
MSRRQKAREKRAEQQWANDIRWLMGDERGRRIVAWLLEQGHFNKCVFTGNSSGNFMQGQQALAIQIANECRVLALKDFHRMEVESLASVQREVAERLADESDDPDAGTS